MFEVNDFVKVKSGSGVLSRETDSLFRVNESTNNYVTFELVDSDTLDGTGITLTFKQDTAEDVFEKTICQKDERIIIVSEDVLDGLSTMIELLIKSADKLFDFAGLIKKECASIMEIIKEAKEFELED